MNVVVALLFQIAIVVAVSGLILAGTPASAEKIKIEKLSDLPPHTYAITGKPSVMVEDPAAVLELAGRVDADIAKDLETYDIQDRTTLKRFAATQLTVAMLRKDWDKALGFADQIRSLEDKPADKLMSGLMTRAIVAGVRAPAGQGDQAFHDALEKSIAALPFDDVRENIKEGKSRAEIVSRPCGRPDRKLIDTVAVTSGKLSQDFAVTLLAGVYAPVLRPTSQASGWSTTLRWTPLEGREEGHLGGAGVTLRTARA